MSIISTWSPIETYTALYIKAVRTRGYNKSLYSFVSMFGESGTILIHANKIMRGFVKAGLIIRKSRQRYTWNRDGKYILAEELHEFCNKHISNETRTICKWKVQGHKYT